ncbi:hypothetical protein DFQ28_009585 [Apophysomyces sp. BC1034]|nr:hypothetical protein DFQ30_009547 [Apophysomyces sp. BC1015]KAG0172205.1 hypothetical protein DFQ29_008478 [Apophysomyces sp. BC1021]KAG0185285.1 hypothetical protein DFQ28_009585 [Apophysomyces sp. BC1034]
MSVLSQNPHTENLISSSPHQRTVDDSASNVQSVPTCDTIIDLSILKGDRLKQTVLQLARSVLPEWSNVQSVDLFRVSGALTNAVFFVTSEKKQRVLLRVYGIGCDQIVDREKELVWLSRLSSQSLCPNLLAIFGNGRFEEYLASTTLTRKDMRDPETSMQIAACIRQLHSIVNDYPLSGELEIWRCVDKWYPTVLGLLPVLKQKSNSDILEKFDLERLQHEIEKCKSILASSVSPIVVAHNDTQYGNVLRLESTGELVVVDFEYAGHNTRGYDIANHFCEWMYDYHSDQPAAMQTDKFPTDEEQLRFLEAYLNALNDNHDKEAVKDLQKEVLLWAMASHLMWGLWGLIQASQSDIDFDYFLYSIQRLNAFRSEIAKWTS